MLKRIGMVFAMVAFVAFVASCGPAIDQELVGKWGVDGSLVYEFKANGEMGFGGLSGLWYYEASNGEGKYWAELLGVKSDETTFTYKVSGDTLEITIEGYSKETLTRM